MLTYTPGDTLAHRLDPRSKLAVQVAVAVAAFAHTTPRGLVVLGVVTAACLTAARTDPLGALWGYRFLLPFLLFGVVAEALTWGPPWVVPADGVDPALAAVRVLLVALVSAAYIRSTPVRESRAAIEWLVPGKPGRLLGTGVGLVFRFLPLLRRDLAAVRDASRARLGERRPLRERMRTTAVAGLDRAFSRADRLALALQARCFAWNPTLPNLALGRRDFPALGLALALAAWALV